LETITSKTVTRGTHFNQVKMGQHPKSGNKNKRTTHQRHAGPSNHKQKPSGWRLRYTKGKRGIKRRGPSLRKKRTW